MVHYLFKIVYVQRGQEAVWRGWAEPDPDSEPHFDRRSIGKCELIEAHDIEGAVQIAKRRYPDCSVMREGCERLCRA